ncbi:aminoglycoside phosphotransferase family protein [Streptomyces brasiliscabiei]|uniref:Aminoglycoside phosphotransferase family protein n=1 Tax=Streptomyces brasiliscabiei TaxID=2736302 RepID=A0ABU8GTP0_9ACTN
MTPPLVSEARRIAAELGGDSGVVKGPLQGYHHETYVLCLPGDSRVVKVREPRAEILWFDRRCFLSEEQLLRALRGRISRVPDIVDVEGMGFQGFIEGRTVGRHLWRGGRVPDAVFDQILGLFRELTRITPESLPVARRCVDEDRPADGDCDGFLDRLIAFCEEQVFERNHGRSGTLFGELGLEGESFTRLRKNVSGLRERAFCLLHGDIHRNNLIVDPEGRLWTIDWELAMFGDPLYDLASHLHLTKYPASQGRRMARAWCEVVERTWPGSSRGWEEDLRKLLDFKKAQSVFTDVVRVSESLLVRDGTGFDWAALPWAARKLQKVLVGGAGALVLDRVPSHPQIMGALVRWHRAQG